MFTTLLLYRSESPSSQQSSPPISPGCEDQAMGGLSLSFQDQFKKPYPPMRQDLPPLYSVGYPYNLLSHGGSAFHRPIDASGKPIPVSLSIPCTNCIQCRKKLSSFIMHSSPCHMDSFRRNSRWNFSPKLECCIHNIYPTLPVSLAFTFMILVLA